LHNNILSNIIPVHRLCLVSGLHCNQMFPCTISRKTGGALSCTAPEMRPGRTVGTGKPCAALRHCGVTLAQARDTLGGPPDDNTTGRICRGRSMKVTNVRGGEQQWATARDVSGRRNLVVARKAGMDIILSTCRVCRLGNHADAVSGAAKSRPVVSSGRAHRRTIANACHVVPIAKDDGAREPY
jgi:hypothetical protein